QLAVRDNAYLAHQLLMRVAAADDLPAALPARLPVRFRALPLFFRIAFEGIDAFRDTHRCCREAQKRLQGIHVDGVEACGVERIERQQTPRPPADQQRTTKAVVYFEMPAHA